MSVAIRKLIARLSASIVAEDDPRKRRSLAASLEAAKKTLKHVEHTETKETPDKGEEDEDGACDKGEEEEEEASGNETDRKEDLPPPKDDKDDDDDDEDKDDDDDDEEEDEEEEAKALAALAAAVPGRKGARLAGRLKALVDKARAADAQAAAIAEIQKERRADKREALVAAALTAKGGPRITPADAKWLRGQKLATVQSYLSQRTRPIVLTEDRAVEGDARASNGLSVAAMKSIEQAVAAGANREKLIAAHMELAAKAGKASY